MCVFVLPHSKRTHTHAQTVKQHIVFYGSRPCKLMSTTRGRVCAGCGCEGADMCGGGAHLCVEGKKWWAELSASVWPHSPKVHTDPWDLTPPTPIKLYSAESTSWGFILVVSCHWSSVKLAQDNTTRSNQRFLETKPPNTILERQINATHLRLWPKLIKYDFSS